MKPDNTPADETGSREALLSTGERAAKNTLARAGGEIVGKLASLALFVGVARILGEQELGVFVFAFAWVQIAMIIAELGYDPYVMRVVSSRREDLHTLVPATIAFKLVRLVPVTAVSFIALQVLDYSSTEKQAVYVLTLGILFDSLARTTFAVFTALERSTLIGLTLVLQRVSAAIMGLAALAAGAGVITVAWTYTVGAGLGLALSVWLLARETKLRFTLAGDWTAVRRLRRESRGFAAKDMLNILLDRLDTVILSILSGSAAVGLYGSAYRLLESTFFIGFAVTGAFSAMFVYLDHESNPTVGAAFERAMKLLLVVLLPIAAVLGLEAGSIVRIFFGPDFEAAADPLRLLAPTVVLLSVATLGATLLLSRRAPRIVVRAVGAVLVVNVVLNLVLVPSLDEVGAAVAMLVSAALFCGLITADAVATAKDLRWARMAGSPFIAVAVMAVPLALLPTAPAIAVGAIAYAGTLLACERALSPDDLGFVVALVRRRGPKLSRTLHRFGR